MHRDAAGATYLKESRGACDYVGPAGEGGSRRPLRGSAADLFAARSAANGYRAGRGELSALALRAAASLPERPLPADLSGR